MKAKLRSSRGETLVETLAAILVLALSALLLANVTVSSARLNRSARKSDTAFRQELKTAETVPDTADGKVTVSDTTGGGKSRLGEYSVLYTRTEDGKLTSYRAAGGTP